MTQKQAVAVKYIINLSKKMIADNLRSNIRLQAIIDRREEDLKKYVEAGGKIPSEESIV